MLKPEEGKGREDKKEKDKSRKKRRKNYVEFLSERVTAS
jgi:hypothetical protein